MRMSSPYVCLLAAAALVGCEAGTGGGMGPTAPTPPTLPARAADGGRRGTTRTVPTLGSFNKRIGVVTLRTGEREGNTVAIEVAVRDHECEDGDRVSIRVERTDSWERVFDGEIFNEWQTRYFNATVGYYYTILAYAQNGTGFKGNCSHIDANSGEMFVGYSGFGEYARWEAPGGDGSVGAINITP